MSRSASIELPRTAEPEDDTSSYKLKVCGYTLNAKSRAPKANAVKQGVPIKLFACLLCKTLFFFGSNVCVCIHTSTTVPQYHVGGVPDLALVL